MGIQKQLLGPDGRPISSLGTVQNKKAAPPKLGTSFGDWAGRDHTYMTLPGGGVVQFDLSKLQLSDFRSMRDHYQINSSLAVLSFMQHQSEFHVECEDPKIAAFCDEQLHNIWTPLNRAMSTANWAGYSPNAIEWDNDYNSQSVIISKIKDLVPEENRVNWKLEPGWAPPGRVPPKFKKFDGIRQWGGTSWPIPVENSFWYPILMENGNYYGTKLLRPAFQSWFFSILLHLFANRYYERFGEPVPVGRAPFDEQIEVAEGTEIPGNQYMLSILNALRSRAAVVLPNTATEDRNGRPNYDYQIEYLESQMRGADFERYMTRLDEEMSIGLFTPILLLRTADVGSYNLGVGHMQMYLWMLNAMNGDRKSYIDPYILGPMVDYNFSQKAPRAKINFHKLGNLSAEILKDVLVALIRKGTAEPDLEQLGQMTGMTIKQIQQTVQPPADPNAPPPEKTPKKGSNDNGNAKSLRGLGESIATAAEIGSRVRAQVEAAFRENRFGPDLAINMGYKRRMEKALDSDGVRNSSSKTNEVYRRMDYWLNDTLSSGTDFQGTDEFMDLFSNVLGNEIVSLSGS